MTAPLTHDAAGGRIREAAIAIAVVAFGALRGAGTPADRAGRA